MKTLWWVLLIVSMIVSFALTYEPREMSKTIVDLPPIDIEQVEPVRAYDDTTTGYVGL